MNSSVHSLLSCGSRTRPGRFCMATKPIDRSYALLAVLLCWPVFCFAQNDAPANKPTLQETLAWLSEKVPLVGGYTYSWGFIDQLGRALEITNTVSTRFGANGCLIIIEKRETSSAGYGSLIVSTDRIPLASVQDVFINTKALVAKGRREQTSGPAVVYRVVVHAAGEDIAHNLVMGKDASTDYQVDRSEDSGRETSVIIVDSPDESMAQRIVKAVEYAANVCRSERAKKPEPF